MRLLRVLFLEVLISAAARIGAAALPESTITAVERLVTAYRSAHRIPGISIAIVADGKLAWSKAYGLADVENSVAATDDTLYRSASIGKTMTATAAMQLVEAGKLDLRAAEMMTPAKLKTGQVVGYGLGWVVETEDWHGARWVFHGGSSPGASGFIAVMPKHRFAVVFLTNLDELPERSELAADIARVVLGFGPPQQP